MYYAREFISDARLHSTKEVPERDLRRILEDATRTLLRVAEYCRVAGDYAGASICYAEAAETAAAIDALDAHDAIAWGQHDA